MERAVYNTALLGTSDKTVKTSWLRIREQPNMGDAVLGACYRPPYQEAFIQKLEVASCLQALVHIGA